jgi:hypothetical protein
MNTIKIGTNERNLGEASEPWISQSINERKADGQNVCIRVSLRTDNVNMVLSTPSCGSGGGGNWEPNAVESEIIEIWKKLGLNTSSFAGGNLVAFVKQIRKYV